jgi:hypothetical protein
MFIPLLLHIYKRIESDLIISDYFQNLNNKKTV